MAGQMAELLKKAFAEKGVQLPGAKVETRKVLPPGSGESSQHTGQSAETPTVSPPAGPKAPTAPKEGKRSDPIAEACKKWRAEHPVARAKAPVKSSQRAAPLACYDSSPAREGKSPEGKVSPYEVRLGSAARLALTLDEQVELEVLDGYEELGRSSQCCHETADDEHLIAMGVDFGTSSIKVVIGDPALGKAFAVPFTTASDVARYLLPTRLHESAGRFSLCEGEETHRDLKLALIANPGDLLLRERVSAMLALVIRQARGWLFATHADVFARTRLLWKLSIGLPVAHHLDDELTQTFNDVAQVAWLAACTPRDISRTTIAAARDRKREIAAAPERMSEDEDVEISVVPEIAAQIYGFVNSSRFNRKEQNIYLMVDVGAGSVDSSLFHVKPARGGKWDFEFFTSIVEPHGVMNLHRHRVGWWEEALSQCSEPTAELISNALAEHKYPTDRTVALPSRFTRYVHDAKVFLRKPSDDPDDTFFQKKVVSQVRGKSYWRAWKDGHLTPAQLIGVPAFYCGGGMRMEFYSKLQNQMQSMPGYSWLRAEPRRVELPKNLEAPGLHRSNYDRMTVAYGLSFLEVGKVTRALPPPKLSLKPDTSWAENYVGKEHC